MKASENVECDMRRAARGTNVTKDESMTGRRESIGRGLGDLLLFVELDA